MTTKGPLKGRAARLGRLMPSGPSTAARTPFVLLVVLLLGGGLITLLLLNSALNQGSFKLRDLKNRTTELTDQEQALQRDVDDRSAPDALERRARELGMVPGGSPAFLDPDGMVRGKPSKASVPEPDPAPTATDTPPPAPPVALPVTPSASPPPAGSAPQNTAPDAITPDAITPDTSTTPATTVPATTVPATTVPDPTTSGR